MSLCFRCEHRALSLESDLKYGPRCECRSIKTSKFSCYMYKPVKPVTLTKLDKDDERSEFAPALFAARSRIAEEEIEMEVTAKIDGENHVRFWRPKESEETNA